MSDTIVVDIKNKLRELVDVLEHTRQQRDVLLQENARLSEQLEAAKKQHHELLSSKAELEEQIKQVQPLPVSDQKAEAKRMEIKGKIRELAAEIDKCIALLNHEK